MLFIAFIGMLLITFGVVAIMLRPTAEQKAVDQRLAVIKASGPGAMLSSNELDQLLKATQNSNFGWLDNLLQTSSFTHKTQLLILQANSKTTLGDVGLYEPGGSSDWICGVLLIYPHGGGGGSGCTDRRLSPHFVSFGPPQPPDSGFQCCAA